MLKRLLAASPVSLDALNRPTLQPFSPQDRVSSPFLAVASEPSPDPALHTIEEVAKRLGVSTKTVQRRIRDGTICKAPIGGRLVRISSHELRRLLSGSALEP